MTFAERIGNEGTEERYNFFKGRIYPALVAIAVFIGYAFELEFYSNIVILASAIVAMLTTDSLKPIILPLLTYLYQVPLAHAPGHPTFSDFYSAPGRLAVIVIMFLLVAAALIFSSVKNRFFTPYGVLHAPFLVPSVILSLAFLLNGVLGGEHTLSGLGYGALQIVTFFVIFYFFYFGLANERGDELVGYLVYCAALIALLLFAETAFVYATCDVISEHSGSIIKENINYGWGVSNTAGQCLTVLLPLLLLGAKRSRYFSCGYFAVAAIDVICVVLTLSRSSILLTAIALVASLIILSCFGERKATFIAVSVVTVIIFIVLAGLYGDKLVELFRLLIDRGFSDNNRFDLWREAFREFTEAPIFGKGFFSLDIESNATAEFFPSMAHNTVLQILGSMGLFGLAAYLFYRVSTAVTFFRYPTLDKTMIGVALLTVLGQSLLDNFIFYFHPMYLFSIALAIVTRVTEDTKHRAFGDSGAFVLQRRKLK